MDVQRRINEPDGSESCHRGKTGGGLKTYRKHRLKCVPIVLFKMGEFLFWWEAKAFSDSYPRV